MRTSLSLRLRSLYLAATIGVLTCAQVTGQTARVQFVNASTYAEADTIDVFLNGRLVLDDFAAKTGKPFRDYPAGVPLKLEVGRGGTAEDAEPFYSETLTLTPGERYFAIAAGDPTRRSDESAFKVFIRSGVPEGSDLPGYTKMVVFNNDPAGAITNTVRGVGEQSNLAKYYEYGEFSDIMFAGKMRWDVDCYQTRTNRVLHIVPDFTLFGDRSILLLGFCGLGILSDGTTWTPVDENVARIQLVNIASSAEADTIDIAVDGQVVLKGLPAGSASAFVEVPSGLREETAPDIRIEVITAGASDPEPLVFLEQKFLFGHRYVSVLGDNPGDDGASPVGIHVADLGADSTLGQHDGGITVFNGSPGPRSITLGVGEPAIGPVTVRIRFGAFET
ncbi:MAG: hypothetical protein R3178_08005 [Rhodothermales bacterium]|nr:hypothetical protein [Rhodothermales bacterium]